MATDKKSFLLYCDLIHTVEQLTDEQAGDLFKHILRYVNDQEPQTDNVITRIAFEPIKQSLKRDLQKYEDIRKRNQDNARKRWDATASDRIPNDTKNADSVSVSVSGSVTGKKEIKGSFLWGSGTHFRWQQIRTAQDYDDVVFVCIYPDRVEFYEADKNVIKSVVEKQNEKGEWIHNQHGGKTVNSGTFFLDGLPTDFNWMKPV